MIGPFPTSTFFLTRTWPHGEGGDCYLLTFLNLEHIGYSETGATVKQSCYQVAISWQDYHNIRDANWTMVSETSGYHIETQAFTVD
jgi:hypothetical protein